MFKIALGVASLTMVLISGLTIPQESTAQVCAETNCISLVGRHEERQQGGQVNYVLTFHNRCDVPVSVRAYRNARSMPGDDGVSGTGIPPGSDGDLNCVDYPNGTGCHGFSRWKVECY